MECSNIKKILLIIPAFNEAPSIVSVVSNLTRNYSQYDYIIVNDCSTDATESICIENAYNYISLPVNLGIGGAVQCGYRYAYDKGYDIAIQFDGDGQHSAEYIHNIVEPLIANTADMVIGSRFINKEGFQSSHIRRLGIAVIRYVIKLCSGAIVSDPTSGFRATNRSLIEMFAIEYAQDYPEPEAIVSATLRGYKVAEVPVQMNERNAGMSSINKLRAIYYMLKVPLALIIYRMGAIKK